MVAARRLDELLDEAAVVQFEGWDFSWLGGRMTVQPPSWDFAALVAKRGRQVGDLLDLGTGGGEWLAGLPYRPAWTVATEAWGPNVPVAARRLRRLGLAVVQVQAASDNAAQRSDAPEGWLPFRTGSFHLVVSRHEAFVAAEVARVLADGGRFLTQQVGEGCHDDIYRLLGLPPPPLPARPWGLRLAVAQAQAVGLRVVASGEGEQVVAFADVGALAWYLKAIPWAVPGFSPAAHRARLAELQAGVGVQGPMLVRQPLFWLEACWPASG